MDWSNKVWILSGIIVCHLFLKCQPTGIQSEVEDPVIASVYKEKLRKSALEELIPEGISKEDSSLMANNFVQRWIKQTLMMREAERNIPKDLNIDQLVKDYRESLILHNYEKQLVEQRLDSTVTQPQLENYYALYQNQYKLEYTIVRCLFISIDRDVDVKKDLKKALKDPDPNISKIETFLDGVPHEAKLDSSTWHRALDIMARIPENKVKLWDLQEGRTVDVVHENRQYLLRVLEKVPAESIAPISYVEDQLKQIILHQRKKDILAQLNDELYQRELNNQNINIFTE